MKEFEQLKTYRVTIKTALGQFVYLTEANHSIDATIAAMERYDSTAIRITVRLAR